MNYKLLFLIPALILSACSTPKSTSVLFQEVQTIPPDSAIVYFYRPKADFNWAGWAELFIDDEKKFPLVNNSYGYVFLDAGEYDIKFEGSTWGTNWWPGPALARLPVVAGREYYIRIEPLEPGSTVGTMNWGMLVLITETFSNYSKAQTDIREVEKSQALKEIRLTTLVEQ
jgi:hypothetical protein